MGYAKGKCSVTKEDKIMVMELIVRVEDGNVYINGEFVEQLCWDAESIGGAVTTYLEDEKNM